MLLTVLSRSRAPFAAALLLSATLTLATGGAALAAPAVGFVEEWPGTSTQGWATQSLLSNPGAGGVGGGGYLRFSTPNGNQHRLGVHSFGAEYSGDWQAAGVTHVRLWLNDVDAADPLEIHFSIGDGTSNFWQYDIGFLPVNGQWTEFMVDLTSDANWTRIIGAGTFAQALQNVDRIHLRHDLPPFVQAPDELDADVGLDRLMLSNTLSAGPPAGAVVPRALRLAAPAPNPSRGPVTFALEVADDAPVTLDVVDVSGRRVRRAVITAGGAGTRTWVWDGRDDAGRPTPAGYYRVRATGAAGGASRGLVRVD